MNVTGYQLNKCGRYYYLSLDRARLKTIPNPIHHQLEDVADRLDEFRKKSPGSESACESPGKIL